MAARKRRADREAFGDVGGRREEESGAKT